MKKLFLSIAAIAMALFSANLFADTKIAMVDVQQVVQSMPEFSQISAELQKQFAEKEKQIVASKTAWKEAVEKFNRNSTVMKEDERKAEQQKLVTQQHEIKKSEIAFEKELSEAQNKKIAVLLDRVKKIVASVAAQQKYNLVMIRAGVLYSDNQVTDITKQVMDAVKKK